MGVDEPVPFTFSKCEPVIEDGLGGPGHAVESEVGLTDVLQEDVQVEILIFVGVVL